MKKIIIILTLCFTFFFTSCLTSSSNEEEIKEESMLKISEAYSNLNENKNYRTEIELEMNFDGETETGSITKNMTEDITKYTFITLGLNLEYYEYVKDNEKYNAFNANFLGFVGSNYQDKWVESKSTTIEDVITLDDYLKDEYYDLVDGSYVLNETGKEKLKEIITGSSSSSILGSLPESTFPIDLDNVKVEVTVKVDEQYITSINMKVTDNNDNEIKVKMYFNRINEVSLSLPKNVITMEEYLKELVGNLPSIPELDEEEIKDMLENILNGGK